MNIFIKTLLDKTFYEIIDYLIIIPKVLYILYVNKILK